MTRRVARPSSALLMILTLLPSVAAPGPLAQEKPAPPPEGSPGRTAEQPSATPPYVLSLQDTLKAALEGNLDIVVRSFDPRRSEELVTASQAPFDPQMTGSATSSLDEETFHRAIDKPPTNPLTDFAFPSSNKQHTYTAGFQDPLKIGGTYNIDISAIDAIFAGSQFDFPTFSTFPTLSQGYQASWKVSYTQSLLRNLGPKANGWLILVAKNNLGISESQFRQTVIDTLASAEKAYWDLNFALMDLKTKRSSLQLATDFMEQNRIKVRVGTLAPIEITQAEAGVADREEAVIIAESAVKTAEDALRQVMNVPRDSPIWSQSITPSDPPPLNEVVVNAEEAGATAETSRPDLEQARLNVSSKETELVYRRNQRRWALDFNGFIGHGGVSGLLSDTGYPGAINNLRSDFQTDWSASLSLGVPIGNRQAVAAFTRVEYEVSQARYDLERLTLAARIEVRSAVRQVETNLKRVRAAQVNVRLQREKLSAEQKKFENGMSTSFQVLSFQNDLASAESRENQAIVDYNKSLAELERVKGTLLRTKNMVMPSTPGPGGAGRTGSPSLSVLWKGAPESVEGGGAQRSAGESGPANVRLPAYFAFDGKRIVPGRESDTGSAGGR